MSKNAIITGGGSGLGLAIFNALHATGWGVMSMDMRDLAYPVDLRDASGVWRWAENNLKNWPQVDLLVNCAGINRIDYLEDLREQDWDLVMDSNAKSIYLVTQAILPRLIAAKGTILNITSNAAHMPMTSSLAYNASKGAAEIMTKQMARELTKRHGITVFGIAPNKLAGTGMSTYLDTRVPEQRGWTEEQAKQYQLSNILCGEETDPKELAALIAYLVSTKQRHKFLTGCILPYGL